mgnify:CR=1 FL=1
MAIKEKKIVESLFKELKEINRNLRKFLLLIPEESIKEYENAEDIKRALSKATRLYNSAK